MKSVLGGITAADMVLALERQTVGMPWLSKFRAISPTD
tara:strand:- start:388 stop:501 length:114 start_codon:yes stop_codon:yes gene_type:complete